MKLEFVVFNYIFGQLDQLVSDPKGLDDLKIGAHGDQYAQKLLHVVKFTYVLVSRLFGNDKILQGQHRKLVRNLHRGSVRNLHLHEGAFCLQGCT